MVQTQTYIAHKAIPNDQMAVINPLLCEQHQSTPCEKKLLTIENQLKIPARKIKGETTQLSQICLVEEESVTCKLRPQVQSLCMEEHYLVPTCVLYSVLHSDWFLTLFGHLE